MAADVTSAPTDAYVTPMRLLGWCHNGYHNALAAEVLRRAGLARLDALIIKYGDPEFERAITDAGLPWGVERFAYAVQPDREAGMLADAVDAGAGFAVANCEPNDGGGWGDDGAGVAIRTLIDAFRARHASVPLFIAADPAAPAAAQDADGAARTRKADQLKG